MGIEFVKAKVAKITEDEEQNPIVRIEVIDEDGRVEERKHDMVVLSLGMRPAWNGDGIERVGIAEDGFIRCPQPKLAPVPHGPGGRVRRRDGGGSEGHSGLDRGSRRRGRGGCDLPSAQRPSEQGDKRK